jgi:alpha-L-arabinofuranosidase
VPNHGVTLGVTEMGIKGDNPNVTAVWYASTLGVFADEGVELFTPWTWKTGMWEVLHLFSRYHQAVRVQASSNQEAMVSAYASTNADRDTMTIILVNRSLDRATEAHVTLADFPLTRSAYTTLTLSGLPTSETFRSHTDNALQEGAVLVTDGRMDLSLLPLSVVAVLLWDEPNLAHDVTQMQ